MVNNNWQIDSKHYFNEIFCQYCYHLAICDFYNFFIIFMQTVYFILCVFLYSLQKIITIIHANAAFNHRIYFFTID